MGCITLELGYVTMLGPRILDKGASPLLPTASDQGRDPCDYWVYAHCQQILCLQLLNSFESWLTNVFQANDYLYEFTQDFVSPTLRYNNKSGSEEHLKCAWECEEKMERNAKGLNRNN